MKENMFEKASRFKLRFKTGVGDITAEDLWDLPLLSRNGVDLDTLAKSLNKAVKESGEESFVLKKSGANTVLELKLEIVKRVIEVKMEEAEARDRASDNKAKKEHIMSIIADKESEGLKGMDIEDLKKMVADL